VRANRTLVQDSEGGYITSFYHDANRLRRRSTGGADQPPLHMEFDYTPEGRLDEIRRYTGAYGPSPLLITSKYEYDERGRTTHILHTDSEAETLSEFNYEYDEAGQITDQAEFQDHVDVTPRELEYAYDLQEGKEEGKGVRLGFLTMRQSLLF
jgi:hypothetical protein